MATAMSSSAWRRPTPRRRGATPRPRRRTRPQRHHREWIDVVAEYEQGSQEEEAERVAAATAAFRAVAEAQAKRRKTAQNRAPPPGLAKGRQRQGQAALPKVRRVSRATNARRSGAPNPRPPVSRGRRWRRALPVMRRVSRALNARRSGAPRPSKHRLRRVTHPTDARESSAPRPRSEEQRPCREQTVPPQPRRGELQGRGASTSTRGKSCGHTTSLRCCVARTWCRSRAAAAAALEPTERHQQARFMAESREDAWQRATDARQAPRWFWQAQLLRAPGLIRPQGLERSRRAAVLQVVRVLATLGSQRALRLLSWAVARAHLQLTRGSRNNSRRLRP